MSRRGFTLIELVIVAASFSIIFLIATTVYTNAFKSHRKVQSTQRTASDARYTMETIARSIRLGTVDYAFYTAYPSHVLPLPDIIAIIDQNGVGTCYKLVSGKILSASYTSGSNCESAVYTDITPTDISVDTFNVRLYPTSDPFAAAALTPPNTQPYAVIYLKATSTVRGERVTTTLQTTVVSRLYKR